MTHFLDTASDVVAFAKNAGSQSLRIDCLTAEGRRSYHAPDFIVRLDSSKMLLVETKGRVDPDVAYKALSAVEWCRAASTSRTKWDYVYVPQAVFERSAATTMAELVRACGPSRIQLLKQATAAQLTLSFSGEATEQSHPAE